MATGDCRATSTATRPARKATVRRPGHRRPREANRQSARRYQYASPTSTAATAIENGPDCQAVRAVCMLNGCGRIPGISSSGTGERAWSLARRPELDRHVEDLGLDPPGRPGRQRPDGQNGASSTAKASTVPPGRKATVAVVLGGAGS